MSILLDEVAFGEPPQGFQLEVTHSRVCFWRNHSSGKVAVKVSQETTATIQVKGREGWRADILGSGSSQGRGAELGGATGKGGAAAEYSKLGGGRHLASMWGKQEDKQVRERGRDLYRIHYSGCDRLQVCREKSLGTVIFLC